MVGLTELIWRLRKNLIGVRQATDRSLLWHRLFADSALQSGRQLAFRASLCLAASSS
jgi:hypothetical protein